METETEPKLTDFGIQEPKIIANWDSMKYYQTIKKIFNDYSILGLCSLENNRYIFKKIV